MKIDWKETTFKMGLRHLYRGAKYATAMDGWVIVCLERISDIQWMCSEASLIVYDVYDSRRRTMTSSLRFSKPGFLGVLLSFARLMIE